MTHRALCQVLAALLLFAAGVARAESRLELSVVTDWQTVMLFGSPEQAEQAIDSIVAHTAAIYKEQLGIELVLTSTQVPQDPTQDDVPADTQPEFLLRSMQEYRTNHPKHRAADVTALISSRNLHIGSKIYSGYANIGPVCSATSVALLSLQSTGLEAVTLAHEIAHTLGASHDGEVPCENESRTGWIMAASGTYGGDHFSACSVEVIRESIERFGDCISKPALAATGSGSTAPAVANASKGSNGGAGSWDALSALALAGVLLFRLGPLRLFRSIHAAALCRRGAVSRRPSATSPPPNASANMIHKGACNPTRSAA
jgi:hypothetical protein